MGSGFCRLMTGVLTQCKNELTLYKNWGILGIGMCKSQHFSADGGPAIHTDINCLLCRYGKYWLPLNIICLFVCVMWCTNVAFLSLAFCPFFSSPSSRLILVSRRIISWDGLLVENSRRLSLTQGIHVYDALSGCIFVHVPLLAENVHCTLNSKFSLAFDYIPG